jgi:hypothetical protein
MRAPVGRLAGQHRATRVGARRALHLDELDGDLAVQAERELVVAAGEPRRHALGAHHLLDVLHVLGHHDPLVGLDLLATSKMFENT